MMNSDYGRNQFPLAAFSSLLSSCSVPASSYTYSYTPLPTATDTTTSSTNNPTSTPVACRGSTYVVQEEDTCESISLSKSIATDRMIQRNNLDYACSSLAVGAELCIEDTCTTYTVKANDTCNSIIHGQSFGLVQLVGWNPTLHENCDNLDSMVGRSLCVS
jgi:LysM repeat protein